MLLLIVVQKISLKHAIYKSLFFTCLYPVSFFNAVFLLREQSSEFWKSLFSFFLFFIILLKSTDFIDLDHISSHYG